MSDAQCAPRMIDLRLAPAAAATWAATWWATDHYAPWAWIGVCALVALGCATSYARYTTRPVRHPGTPSPRPGPLASASRSCSRAWPARSRSDPLPAVTTTPTPPAATPAPSMRASSSKPTRPRPRPDSPRHAAPARASRPSPWGRSGNPRTPPRSCARPGGRMPRAATSTRSGEASTRPLPPTRHRWARYESGVPSSSRGPGVCPPGCAPPTGPSPTPAHLCPGTHAPSSPAWRSETTAQCPQTCPTR